MFSLRTADSVMNEIYDRILLNKPFDKNLRPYTKKEVKMALFFFEDREEYEKCKIINDFIKKRFSHGVEY